MICGPLGDPADREVVRRMGIEDAIRAAGTGGSGLRFVDDDGCRIAAFPAGANDADGPSPITAIRAWQSVR